MFKLAIRKSHEHFRTELQSHAERELYDVQTTGGNMSTETARLLEYQQIIYTHTPYIDLIMCIYR